MSVVCISRVTEANIIRPASEFMGKCVKVIRRDMQIEDRLWIRTPYYMVMLHDNEEPLARCPSLILQNNPGQFRRPKYGIFTGLKVPDDMVFLFFQITNNTAMKIPRFTVTLTRHDIEELTVGGLFEKAKATMGAGFIIKEFIARGKVLEESTPLKDVIVFTSNFPSLAFRVEVSPEGEKRMRHRINIITEIIETEETYLNDLSCLLNFWRDMFSARNMMNDQELNVFFKDIPAIINCHETFLSVVKKANKGYKTKLGYIFADYSAYFKVSTQFVAGYPNMLELFNQKKQAKGFLTALDEIRRMNDGRDFTSYLVTPVQRLPRYSLFLKEMLKYTPMGHPDAATLPIAFDKMEDVNCQIDSAARLEKERSLFARIQEKLKKSGETTIQMVKAGRRIITTANVSVTNKHKAVKSCVLYVCNDILFLLSDRGRNMKIPFMCDVFAFHYTNVAKDYRSIHVVHYRKEKEKVVDKNYIVIFASGEEKATVIDQIERLQHDFLRHCNGKAITWTIDPLSESVTPLCQQAAVGNGEYIVFFGGLSTDYRLISGDFFTYRHEDEVLQNVPISQMTVTESKTHGRHRHTLTYMDGRMYIIGGVMKSENPAYIIEFDLDTKTYINACKSAIISRYGHTCNAYNGKLYVFGGKSKANVYYNDIIEIDPTNKTVKTLEVGDLKPDGRCDHSTVLYGGHLIVFGGKGCRGVLGDLWAFDIEHVNWKKLSTSGKPQPRRGHLAFLLETNMIIIGGVSSSFEVMPTMTINLSDWRLTYVRDIGNFPQTLRHASGAIMNNTNIIIYGGMEYKSRVPQNTIYRLQLNRRWKARRFRGTGLLDSTKWDAFLNGSCCHTVMSHKSTWVPTRPAPPRQASDSLMPVARKVDRERSRKQQHRASLALSSPDKKVTLGLDTHERKEKPKKFLQLSHDEKTEVSVEKLSEESEVIVNDVVHKCNQSTSMPGILMPSQGLQMAPPKISDWKTLPIALVQRRSSCEIEATCEQCEEIEVPHGPSTARPVSFQRARAKTFRADGKRIPVSAMSQVPDHSGRHTKPGEPGRVDLRARPRRASEVVEAGKGISPTGSAHNSGRQEQQGATTTGPGRLVMHVSPKESAPTTATKSEPSTTPSTSTRAPATQGAPKPPLPAGARRGISAHSSQPQLQLSHGPAMEANTDSLLAPTGNIRPAGSMEAIGKQVGTVGQRRAGTQRVAPGQQPVKQKPQATSGPRQPANAHPTGTDQTQKTQTNVQNHTGTPPKTNGQSTQPATQHPSGAHVAAKDTPKPGISHPVATTQAVQKAGNAQQQTTATTQQGAIAMQVNHPATKATPGEPQQNAVKAVQKAVNAQQAKDTAQSSQPLVRQVVQKPTPAGSQQPPNNATQQTSSATAQHPGAGPVHEAKVTGHASQPQLHPVQKSGAPNQAQRAVQPSAQARATQEPAAPHHANGVGQQTEAARQVAQPQTRPVTQKTAPQNQTQSGTTTQAPQRPATAQQQNTQAGHGQQPKAAGHPNQPPAHPTVQKQAAQTQVQQKQATQTQGQQNAPPVQAAQKPSTSQQAPTPAQPVQRPVRTQPQAPQAGAPAQATQKTATVQGNPQAGAPQQPKVTPRPGEKPVPAQQAHQQPGAKPQTVQRPQAGATQEAKATGQVVQKPGTQPPERRVDATPPDSVQIAHPPAQQNVKAVPAKVTAHSSQPQMSRVAPAQGAQNTTQQPVSRPATATQAPQAQTKPTTPGAQPAKPPGPSSQPQLHKVAQTPHAQTGNRQPNQQTGDAKPAGPAQQKPVGTQQAHPQKPQPAAAKPANQPNSTGNPSTRTQSVEPQNKPVAGQPNPRPAQPVQRPANAPQQRQETGPAKPGGPSPGAAAPAPGTPSQNARPNAPSQIKPVAKAASHAIQHPQAGAQSAASKPAANQEGGAPRNPQPRPQQPSNQAQKPATPNPQAVNSQQQNPEGKPTTPNPRAVNSQQQKPEGKPAPATRPQPQQTNATPAAGKGPQGGATRPTSGPQAPRPQQQAAGQPAQRPITPKPAGAQQTNTQPRPAPAQPKQESQVAKPQTQNPAPQRPVQGQARPVSQQPRPVGQKPAEANRAQGNATAQAKPPQVQPKAATQK